MEIKSLKDEITADSIRCRRASEDERSEIRAQALEKLARLEQITKHEDRLTRQYILGRRAYFGCSERLYTYEEQLDMLMEAIHLTAPRFDLDEINLGLYSIDEARIINQIAVTYSKIGKSKKAADIYSQLLKYVEKHHKNLTDYGSQFCLIAQNYAIELDLKKQYDEAIEVANKGRQICAEYGHYQFLEGSLVLITGLHLKKY